MAPCAYKTGLLLPKSQSVWTRTVETSHFCITSLYRRSISAFTYLSSPLYSSQLKMAFVASSRNGAGENRSLKKQLSKEIRMMHPHDLAKDLHSLVGSLLVLDCRPILAYNSCHITGMLQACCMHACNGRGRVCASV